MIDKFTRWPELVPITNIEASTIARKFFETWICRYGCPAKIVTDQGTQFESELFQKLCQLCGIQKCRSTPYHPQSNGSIERMHRTLKSILTCLVQDYGFDWNKHLQSAALSLRTTLHTGTNAPPCLLMFGQQLTIPQDLSFNAGTPLETRYILQGLNDLHNIARRSQRTSYSNKGRSSNELNKGDYVWITRNQKNALKPNYHGPYKITQPTLANNHITIQIGNKEKTISSYNIKKCLPIENHKNIYNAPNLQIENGTQLLQNHSSLQNQPIQQQEQNQQEQPIQQNQPILRRSQQNRKPNKHDGYVYF